jgi:uncharacterized ferritin-like protein (DUF455 family)
MQARLEKAGDHTAVAILDIILREEIGHVAIGNRWYAWACQRAGLNALSHFAALVAEHQAPRIRGPLNLPARRAAGFSDAELERLCAQTQGNH